MAKHADMFSCNTDALTLYPLHKVPCSHTHAPPCTVMCQPGTLPEKQGCTDRWNVVVAVIVRAYTQCCVGCSCQHCLSSHLPGITTGALDTTFDVCVQFVFVFATAAACVASQAMISAAFSIIKQSIALGCFPQLTVQHVSEKVCHSCLY